MSWKCSPVVGSSKINSVPAFFASRHVRGELQALRLAAGERRHRLAQAQVFQPDGAQRLESIAFTSLAVFEKLQGIADGEIEHLANILAAVGDFEDFFAETAAVTFRAGSIHIGEKLHLDFFVAFAAAGLAAAALDVERKRRRRVAAQARQIGAGEQLADAVEGFHVSRRVGARRGAHRRLIDQDDFGDFLDAVDLLRSR